MRIKEQDSSRLVIEPGLGDRVKGIALLVVVIGLLIFAVIVAVGGDGSGVIPPIGVAIFLLYFAGRLLGRKIVIDKLTEYITITNRSLMLFTRQRVIDFSEVERVWVDEASGYVWGGQYGGGFSYKAWKVSMFIGRETIKIDQSIDEDKMFSLASKLRKFIGLEVEKREPLRKTEFAGRIEVPSIEKSKASEGPKCANCGKPILGLPFKIEGGGAEEYYCFRCKSRMTSWSRK